MYADKKNTWTGSYLFCRNFDVPERKKISE